MEFFIGMFLAYVVVGWALNYLFFIRPRRKLNRELERMYNEEYND